MLKGNKVLHRLYLQALDHQLSPSAILVMSSQHDPEEQLSSSFSFWLGQRVQADVKEISVHIIIR